MRFPTLPPLTDAIVELACAHAVSQFPKESCGLVVDGRYVPCPNLATLPERDFRIDPATVARLSLSGRLEAVVHSHTTLTGKAFPSGLDMQQQLATGVPWAIVLTDGREAGLASLWGAGVPVAPIVGRPFLHGVHDCYSLVRDVFALGRDALADPEVATADGSAGIDWPHPPIALPEYPRSDAWWEERDGLPAQDLYADHFRAAGFREIPREQARGGDAFVMCHGPHKVLNHAGVLVGDGDWIVHHLGGKLSNRDMTMRLRRQVRLWLRHESAA